ncbi:hypothetical protein HDF26_002999 [Pedobacter cryoconitis]|uniref:Uncharacterized protein n=1 Tax=Pedobacter cryoconitis TaxID=188932 RepID=A0A7W8ZI85_9SPHI|nr:hypothetical protein [Pedobacter cryoconitis]MBB5634335.1 hypothetical protein [Pedobacter cryoconitis]MBB6272542.1 hypothetical protein [Pedobacter cryoconitis]
MQRIQKVLRLIGMVLLIGLASFGLSVGGAVPIPAGRQKYPSENVETKEEKDEDLKPDE